MLVDIEKVIVPDRARKTFTNIDKLAESISENGLINPPTVTPDLELIAGERRLRACKKLGFHQIEVRVMPVSDEGHHLRLERDENDKREPFTFSEAVELGRRIEEIEREKARDRQGERTDIVQNFAQGSEGKSRDAVAEQAGFGSGEQFRKAKFIADNADPELIQQLDEKAISIHAAYRQLKADRDAAEQRAAQAEAARQLAINQHSEQQDKLLAQIDELKRKKGRSPEDEAELQQLHKEKQEAEKANRRLLEEMNQRNSDAEHANYNLRKLKEALNKTRAYVEVDLGTALAHLVSIPDNREAIEEVNRFWTRLGETVERNRNEFLKILGSELEVLDDGSQKARRARQEIIIDHDSGA